MNRPILFATAVAALVAAGIAAVALHPTGLPSVTDDAQVFNANRTVLVLVTGNNCPACDSSEQVLAKHASRHPEFKILKLATDDNMSQPSVVMVVPGADEPTYRNTSVTLTEDNVEAFLAARAKSAAEEKPIVAQIAALKAQKTIASQSYDEQLDTIRVQADRATANDDAQIANLRAQAQAIRAPFDAQIADQQKLEDAAAAPFELQLMPIRAAEATAFLPILTEIEQVQKDMAADKTLIDLRDQYAAAKQAGDTAMMDKIADQYKIAAKPYQDKMASIKQKFDTVSKQFDSQMAPILAQEDAACKQYKDAIADLQAKSDAAAKPYDDQVTALRADEEKILAPYRAQAAPIVTARDKATAPIDAQIDEAQKHLTSLMQSDEPQDN